MVEQTRAHVGDLNEPVETPDGVARHARAWRWLSRTRADIKADELGRLCSAQVRGSADHGHDSGSRERSRSARRGAMRRDENKATA